MLQSAHLPLPQVDLLIAGSGPSALRLAADSGRAGLSVIIVSPTLTDVFPESFGLFEDQIPEALRDAVRCRWDAVSVRVPGNEHTLDRPYARLNSAALHMLLHRDARDQGCVGLEDRVLDATLDGAHFDVRLASGARCKARRVVDCTGHRRVLVAGQAAEHHQVALGATLVGPHGLTRPLLMDFTGETEGTFLYALPLSPTELFVEETALITAKAPGWEQLEKTLRLRLRSIGLVGELTVHEHCVIPMDTELPDLTSPVVAFGAAAGLVHPATGYQLAASLALSAPLATCLRDTLDQSPTAAAQACWEVLWPSERQRVRELRLFGARFIAGLSREDQAGFFDAFFQLRSPLVDAYLAHNGGLADTCIAMLHVFATLPYALRWRLIRRALGNPMPLVRPLVAL